MSELPAVERLRNRRGGGASKSQVERDAEVTGVIASDTEVVRAHIEEAMVRRFLVRWAQLTDRRLRAAHPQRPGWNACRRALFAEQLRRDLPSLSEPQRMGVLAAFDALAERAVIRGLPGLPPLAMPGRVGQLVDRLDIGSIL